MLTLSLEDVVTAGEDAELLAISKAVLGLISVTLVPSIIIFTMCLNLGLNLTLAVNC